MHLLFSSQPFPTQLQFCAQMMFNLTYAIWEHAAQLRTINCCNIMLLHIFEYCLLLFYIKKRFNNTHKTIVEARHHIHRQEHGVSVTIIQSACLPSGVSYATDVPSEPHPGY